MMPNCDAAPAGARPSHDSNDAFMFAHVIFFRANDAALSVSAIRSASTSAVLAVAALICEPTAAATSPCTNAVFAAC